MNCPTCNNELAIGAKFCPQCGQRIELPESQETETNPQVTADTAEEAAVTTDFVQEAAAQTASQVPMQDMSSVIPGDTAAPGQEKRKSGKKWVIAGISVIVVLALAAIAFYLVKTGAFTPKKSLVYITENELQVYNPGHKDSFTAASSIVKDDDAWKDFEDNGLYYGGDRMLAKLNKDGTRLFYMADIDTSDLSGTLYYRDLKSQKKNEDSEDGTKIASGVSPLNYTSFTIDEKGSFVLYSKNGKLYINNIKEDEVIDDDVTDYRYSEKASQILYLKSTGDGEGTLYLKGANLKDDKEKIDSNVNQIVGYSDDFTKIYYAKKSDDLINSLTVYIKEKGKDKDKLVSDIENVIVLDENTGNMFYTKTVQSEKSLDTLVDDDMASTDAGMQEPNISNYQTETQVPQYDWWTGETYYTTNTQTDYDSFYADQNKYSQKLNRDVLRDSLKNETITAVSSELYLLNKGESKKITEDYNSFRYSDPKTNTLVYNKVDNSTPNKVKLSEITSTSDVRDAYNNNSNQSAPETYIVLNGGKETELFDDDKINNITIAEDNKTLYCIDGTDSDDNTGEFLSYDISTGKLKDKKTIDSDVYTFYTMENNDIYYFKDAKDYAGDLYLLSSGKAKTQKIASDVYMYFCQLFNDSQTLLYLSDYDTEDYTGTLKMYNGKEETKIANDVNNYFFNSPSDIYYITDYDKDKGCGDLEQFVGKDKPNEIDEDVYRVITTATATGEYF